MTSKQDKEMEIKITLRELIIYVMFVLLLAISMYSESYLFYVYFEE